jgi:hypothetical protein
MGLARQKWGDGVEYGYLEQIMALCLKSSFAILFGRLFAIIFLIFSS